MYLQNILSIAQKKLSSNNFVAFKHYVKKILKITSSDIVLNSVNIKLKSCDIKKLFKFIQKANKNYPLAYLFKEQDFGKNTFYVNSHTLIPREDSMTLVENFFHNFTNSNQELKILDLGVGSGCLIITLLQNYQNASGVGIDINFNTLFVAKKNLKKFNLKNKCQLICNNMLNGINKTIYPKFDAIISNPPYISYNDTNIANDVKKYEPKRALFASHNGLYFYTKIFSQAHLILKKDGIIIVEVGFEQQKDVEKIAHSYNYKLISITKDNQGINRSLAFIHN